FGRDFAIKLKASFARAPQGSSLGKVLGEEGPNLLETMLTRPLVAYVGTVDPGPRGPMIRAGIAVNLGDSVAKTKASLEKIQQAVARSGAAGAPAGGDSAETGAGNTAPAVPRQTGKEGAGDWQTLPTPADAPPIQWGIKDRYLVIGIGE